MTHAAHIQPRDAQLLHRATHGFRECDLDLEFQIAAGLALRGLTRCALAAEYLAEKVAEAGPATSTCAASAAKIKSAEIKVHIFRRAAATVTISATRRRSSALPRLVEPELVIHLTLLGV